MLYYAVVAITTLQLNAYVKDPETTVLIVLAAMIVVPLVIRRVKEKWSVASYKRQATGRNRN
jgi:hypothetical protein